MESQKNVLIREILIANAFVINLFISTISNYGNYSYLLKIFFTLILWMLLFYDLRKSGFQLSAIMKNEGFRKLIIVLGLFLFFPAASLIYSFNPLFGFKKILYLVISTLPAVLAFYYLMYTLTAYRLRVFLYAILIEAVLSVIAVLLIRPFMDYSVYQFRLTNWSHVIYGRFAGLVLLISVFLLLKSGKGRNIILFSSLVIIFSYSAYYTGLRASLLGLIILIIFTVIYLIIKNEHRTVNILVLVISLLISALLSFQFPNPAGVFAQRYETMTNTDSLSYESDGAILSRMDSYKISLERIEQNPLLGLGFGGFKSFYKSSLPVQMSYPHDIFIEFAVEMGIPGLLLLLYLLFIIFKYSYKYSFELFVFFLYAFFLSLFSKDIPTNTMLWLGLVFYSDNRSQKTETGDQKTVGRD